MREKARKMPSNYAIVKIRKAVSFSFFECEFTEMPLQEWEFSVCAGCCFEQEFIKGNFIHAPIV